MMMMGRRCDSCPLVFFQRERERERSPVFFVSREETKVQADLQRVAAAEAEVDDFCDC